MDANWLLERYVAEYNRLAAAKDHAHAAEPGAPAVAGAVGGPSAQTSNGAVARLLSIFAPDAELIFEGHIVAALWGTAEIGRYFRDHAPQLADAMTLTGTTFDGEHIATGEFRRADAPSRRAGTISLVEHEGYIARITITAKART